MASQVDEEWGLQDGLIRHPILKFNLLTLCQHLDISLYQELFLHLELANLLDLFFKVFLLLIHHLMRGLLLAQLVALILEMVFPNLVIVLEGSAPAVALEVVFLLQDELDVIGIIVSHVGNAPGLLEIPIFKFFDFFGLLDNDAIEKLMLIVCFIELVVLAHLGDELFELFDFELVLEGLVGDLPNLGRQVRLFELLVGHRDALLVELKVCFNELQEEEIIVVDEGGQPGLGVQSGAAGVALVGDFFSQIGDDLVKGPEVADVLAHELFGVGVRFLAH